MEHKVGSPMAAIAKDEGDHPLSENIKIHWDIFKSLGISFVKDIDAFRCDIRHIRPVLNGQEVTGRVNDTPNQLNPHSFLFVLRRLTLSKPVIDGTLDTRREVEWKDIAIRVGVNLSFPLIPPDIK